MVHPGVAVLVGVVVEVVDMVAAVVEAITIGDMPILTVVAGEANSGAIPISIPIPILFLQFTGSHEYLSAYSFGYR